MQAKNTYYKLCSYCGAALDPGEKCDCQTERLYFSGKKGKERKIKNDSKRRHSRRLGI